MHVVKHLLDLGSSSQVVVLDQYHRTPFGLAILYRSDAVIKDVQKMHSPTENGLSEDEESKWGGL